MGSQDIDSILEQRRATHGRFQDQAMVAQNLKAIARIAPKWHSMSPEHREAAEMILHKIAHAVSGNPNEADHWLDIEGYAKLARISTSPEE